MRTPLFPLFIAAVGNNAQAVFAGHLALGVLTSLSLLRLFWEMTKEWTCGAAVAIVYALNPSTLWYESAIMSEILATFLVTVGTLFAVKACHGRSSLVCSLGLSSFAFSLAALTRPLFQLLPLTSALLILTLKRNQLRKPKQIFMSTVAALLPFVVLVGGWALVNRARFGWFTLSTMTGYALTQHSGPLLKDAPPEYATIAKIFLRDQESQIRAEGTHSNTIWKARPEMLAATGLTDAQFSRQLMMISLRLFVSHPLFYLASAGRSFRIFWRPAVYHRGCSLHDLGRAMREVFTEGAHSPDYYYAYVYLLFELAYALALVGPVFLKGWRPLLWSAGVRLVHSVVIYTALVSSLTDFGDNSRYKIPVEGLILGIAIIAASLLWQTISTRAQRPPKVLAMGEV